MKKFYIGENKYLEQKVLAFYNCDYVGYQKQGNPDFILPNNFVFLLH